jgi:hypothetical protein
MPFESPGWIILLPVLAFVGWYWKPLQLWSSLRMVALLLGVLLLMNPRWKSKEDGLDLWVLLDRSESTGVLLEQNVAEWLKLLEGSRRSGADRMFLADYASEVMHHRGQETEVYSGSRKLTRTTLAIENTLALSDLEKPTRIVVFTDGFSTEPMSPGLAEKLQEAGVPVDYRLVHEATNEDFRVSRFTAPSRAQIAEPFLLDIAVSGSVDGEVPVKVLRNGQLIGEANVTITEGGGTLRFSDRIGGPGAFRYEAVITPEGDAHAGNNRQETWVEVKGGPRILLVTKYLDDPVAEALEKQGFTVDLVTKPGDLGVGRLSGTRAVIFNNVPAFEVPRDFLSGIDFFVRNQGGGFLMIGGNRSFGSGGYFQSPVDEILPVSMELKMEHLKLVVAMAIIMDRSGSMAMTVPGGKSKMDLADEGAARAVELMGAQDAVCVFAVDSEAHKIVPLQKVGPNRNNIVKTARRIESTGGGIFVFNGLEAGWNELKRSTVGQRHMILFSDAADSEQPHKYKQLLKEITSNGGSVSVIALGTKGDPDAAFLEDIAKRGNGRIFFSNNPTELPSIFSMETVSVARSAFVKEPVPTQATGQWYEISNKAFEWLPEVDGYNLSYVRDWASQALVTTDEYVAPLVAYGQRGVGRTAAISFPMGGEYSGRIREWPKFGDFVQTLGRWLMGEDLPPGIGLRWNIQGTAVTVDLLYNDTWEERLSTDAPKILVASGMPPGPAKEWTWQRMAPGHYRVLEDLDEGEMIRGAIQVGDAAIPFGPLVVGGSAEWAFEEERVEELRQLSAQTGGRELLELSDAWQSPPQEKVVDFRKPLFVLLLLAVLADALITRMGWTLPALALKRRPKTAKTKHPATRAQKALAPVVSKPVAKEPARPKPIAPPAPAAEARKSRFDRAKRGKR